MAKKIVDNMSKYRTFDGNDLDLFEAYPEGNSKGKIFQTVVQGREEMEKTMIKDIEALYNLHYKEGTGMGIVGERRKYHPDNSPNVSSPYPGSG